MPSASTQIAANAAGRHRLEDDGIPGNNRSRIRFPNGAVSNFEHPTDDLIFDAAIAGVTLTINLTDSLGASNLTVGSLTDPGVTPESIDVQKLVTKAAVTLAARLEIRESGSDAAADVVAGDLLLSAGTGIGTGSNAVETQASVLEAETVSGGISIRNFGNLTVGGLTDEIAGVSVKDSGNMLLENFGTILLSGTATDLQSVRGGDISGNVTLLANGLDADIRANVNLTSVRAHRGNVTLTAGRDIVLGTGGTDFNNDVLAGGSMTLNAGRDVILDGLADVRSSFFGGGIGGDAILNAGRNITMTKGGRLSASGLEGDDVFLTTGSGGTLIMASVGTTAVISNSGVIVAIADRMLIGPAGGMTASRGQVTLRAATDGREMILGNATDASFALELSNAELGRIFSPGLVLGGSGTGAITVVSDISPVRATDLTLESGVDIVVNAGVAVRALGNLTLRAGDDILLLAGSSLAAGAGPIPGGTIAGFVDVGNADPGTGGTAFVDGGFLADVRFFGEADSDTLFGGQGDDILTGGGGADRLTGRLGNDIYDVDDPGDTVIEAFSEGTDLVGASVSHTLAANVENLALTGTGDIDGTGNGLDNQLSGNSGDNGLDGRAGGDTMVGRDGDDTYTVDNTRDTVVEASNAGIDLVRSSIAFSLGGKQVENLTLTGSADINGTGNTFANTIIGNNGDNTLNGAAGSDALTGAGGSDAFRFATALGATNIDSITDFNVADDTIELASAIFDTIVGTGSLSLAQFAANATGTAQDANDRIIYDTDSGQVFFDNNGNAAGGRIQFATVIPGLPLTASDFVVV
jgi:hypothetical protein